jgi:hypothetical protein
VLVLISRRRARPASRWSAGLAAALALLVFTTPASGQIRIGFCQGPPGSLVTVTVELVICCPDGGAVSTISATTPPLPCDDAPAVMAGVNAALAGLTFGGDPVFGAPVPVPSPIPGQARFEYPLSPEFLATECCVVGGSIDFDCGTFSLRINPPCAKLGEPGGGGRVTKLCFDSPPLPVPGVIAVGFEGCPIVIAVLDGTETADEVRDALLAALLDAGHTAFINEDGKIEVAEDCTGMTPIGVDEFGMSGGAPMDLGIVICPPPLPPVPVNEASWGELKGRYSD